MSADRGVITAVVVDTTDLDSAVGFWSELLGLDVRHRDARYVYVGPIVEGGPHLAFQLVPEDKRGKNRLHLDVRVPDRERFAARVVELGGSIIGDHQDVGYPRWTVVTDPEGNEFCVYALEERSA